MQAGQRFNSLPFITRATRQQRLIAAIILFSIATAFISCWLISKYKIPIYPFGCGFKQRYGLPCPTCGMTTSVLAFAQGRFKDSLDAQPAAFLLCLLVLAAAFFAFIIAVFGIYFPRFWRWLVSVKLCYYIIILTIILITGWAVTLSKALMAK